MVKNLPAMQETWVRSLAEGAAAHSSILAWRIPWTEVPGRLQSIGSQRVRHDWDEQFHFQSWDLAMEGVTLHSDQGPDQVNTKCRRSEKSHLWSKHLDYSIITPRSDSFPLRTWHPSEDTDGHAGNILSFSLRIITRHPVTAGQRCCHFNCRLLGRMETL